MRKRTFVSSSTKETIRFARDFAKTLQPGRVLALIGDLGTGKTTFVKGLAGGLGLSKAAEEVKSPSFVLMHVYPTRIPLYHFDLYRLESSKDISSIGMDEFLNDPNAISCIEWADRAPMMLPSTTTRICFEIVKKTERRITIQPS